MAITSTRLVIVCTAATRDKMNATLNTIDPTSSGDVMRAALSLPVDPHTTVGYWTSWPMPEEHKVAILAAFNATGWAPLKGSEGKVHQPGDVIPAWGKQRFYLFDGTAWHPDNVLSVLGLELTLVSDE